MQVSATDLRTIIRYLDDAAIFYRIRHTNTRERDRSRLLRNLSKKLSKKFDNEQ